MPSRLASTRLVLVAPLYAGNIGACARVAANFDVKDIRLVNPQCDHLSAEARLYGKGPAAEYLQKMRVHESLAQALEGCAGAIGFSRREGSLRRAQTSVADITGLPAFKDTKPLALVFGREDKCLTTDEILLCTQICSFTISDVMPTMNLSHSVAMVLGRLYEDASRIADPLPQATGETALPRTQNTLADLALLEELFAHWRQAMIDAGIVTGGNPDRMLTHIRRTLQRAQLSPRDVGILRGYLSKTQVALGTRGRDQTPNRCSQDIADRAQPIRRR